ncbi:MAG: tRNA uridine(34) 5-carboxymethylaminomethyl modification radical SAM/GNAT enzyme Elp3 [Eggerthellaceae bacterium]|nr:tRNA uridine(34) 5-carboxymethylaminomethyl modification radical SAM/GNAT enzyme Elp3 [Eggerthellaceae bacterium]
MEELIAHIIAAMRENPDLSLRDVERIMREHNGRAATEADPRPFTKRRLMPYVLRTRLADPELWASWHLTDEEALRLVQLLRVKPRRTQSGVATITVICRPAPCRGGCDFCPTEDGMPKSYLSDEPACQRAVQCGFDPYLQVSRRLVALSEMGHPTGKVELIILGGTWDDYPESYRLWFVRRAFEAMNDFTGLGAWGLSEAGGKAGGGGAESASDVPGEGSAKPALDPTGEGSAKPVVGPTDATEAEPAPGPATPEAFATLFAAQRKNEIAAARCVGLVVETRPDCITPESLTFARALGATKIQVGIQSLDEGILAANGRPMDLTTIRRAFALLRLFGFKSHIHWMLNLVGATPEADVAGYRQLMEDAAFRPDEVKLYPCMLIRGAALEDLWRRGEWAPYSHDTLMDVCAECLAATPRNTRVSRMIRDFSAGDILAGDKTANLRQEVEQRALRIAAERGERLYEMRIREIIRGEVASGELTLHEYRFPTSTGEEVFLEWLMAGERLAGFLRLSLPAADLSAQLTAGTPYAPGTALIREVHVYGTVANVGEGAANAQHQGLGTQLVERAAALARQAGYHRLAVISAVGTRHYYERLGFSPVDAPTPSDVATLYQYREL